MALLFRSKYNIELDHMILNALRTLPRTVTLDVHMLKGISCTQGKLEYTITALDPSMRKFQFNTCRTQPAYPSWFINPRAKSVHLAYWRIPLKKPTTETKYLSCVQFD